MLPKGYIIGDRLNTSNKAVRTAVEFADMPSLSAIAQSQIANGADALDLTACSSGVREEKHLLALLSALPPLAEQMVCSIDTQNPKMIAASRPLLAAPPILNCYPGLLDSLSEMLEAIRSAFPITAVIAVCVDFRGTKVLPARRLDIAGRMAAELSAAGVRPEQIVFDPVTLPSSIGPKAEQVTLDTIRLLREAFPESGVLCAVSNYSYGLPKRRAAEREYVKRAASYGATAFLLNALDARLCRIARESQ